MTEHTTPQPEAPASPELPEEQAFEAAPPRRFERVEEGKWIAGVATGLAEYFSVPVWLVRVIFIFLLPTAGIGILTYLVLIAFMPHEDDEDSAVERWLSGTDDPARIAGIALAVIAVAILLSATTRWDGGILVALALLGVGVMLYQGGGRSGQAPDDDDTPQRGGRPPRPPREPREPRQREPRPPKAPKPPRERSNLGSFTIAGTLIALALLGSADIAGWLYPSAFHYVSVAVIGVGIGLLIGAWRGRSRGLIFLGLALLPLLGVTWVVGNVDTIADAWTAAAGSDVLTGERFVIDEVTGIESLNLGVGEATVDLRDTAFDADGQLRVTMDAGQLTIIVPEDEIRVIADVDLGSIDRPGPDANGIDISTSFGPSQDDALGTVRVSLDVGQIIIKEGN